MCKKIKDKIKEVAKDTKQLVVGLIILAVAILLLVYSFIEFNKDKKVTVTPKEVSLTNTVKFTDKETIKEETPKVEEEKEEENATEASIKKEIIAIEPENVVLTFETETEKDFTYRIFYTQAADGDFNEEMSVVYPNKSGLHKYSIVLPVKEVYKVRIDFGSYPGRVTIRDIHLQGTQTADLNDFIKCEKHQTYNMLIKHDGTFSFSSEKENPYIAFSSIKN